MDLAGLLNVDDAYKLDNIIREVNQLGKAQLQILTIEDLQGEDVEHAGIKVAEAWKLGTKKADNGVLVLIAKKERKIRIEVGRGLEGDLPDVYAKRIIEDVMVPEFSHGRISNGIVQGIFQIISKVAPEYLSKRDQQKQLDTPVQVQRLSFGRFLHLAFILFSLFVVFILPRLPGSRRYYGGGWYGGGGFGGGGGGFSGGGGWSGGGGGFSGGGSSGSW